MAATPNTTNTPILFLIFNRPEPTQRVFDKIRAARPTRLFVAADGPRADRPDEARLCAETRAIARAVDWPCEVETLLRDSNLGCKSAVSSAISWFFSKVEEGIILEDDCLPDQSFFPYCTELLARYKDDQRIMMISGYNALGTSSGNTSYLFSIYGGIWGWAGWRRSWEAYSLDPAVWNDLHARRAAEQTIGSAWQWKIKQWSYEQAFMGGKNTWDYQWEYARLVRGGLSIVPAVNLIENIGRGPDSTHTVRSSLQLPAQQLPLPLVHTEHISIDRTYDEHFVTTVFGRESFFRKALRVLGF